MEPLIIPSSAVSARLDALSALQKGVDILVVGGGINGAGIFRDAALRGLSVGLVEMNDFASGTSCRSSKLIHGGVRYLEHMEFGLVMESSLERALLMRLLPDLVQPAPFLLPVYKESPHGLFVMNLGLWLYDALAFFRNFRLHRRLNAGAVQSLLPALKQKGLKGGVMYYDCRVNDARLVINNVMSGRGHGGSALNYTKVVEIRKSGGKISGALVTDRLTGKTFDVPCRVLISAVGPWTNGFHALLESEEKAILRLTKGIHLMFPKKRFQTETAVVITSADDRRIVFIIPWEEYTLVGTTDTDFSGDLNNVVADARDVEYLLNLVNGYFPGLALHAKDALSAFAGLRPLVLSKGSTSSVSRKDKILRTPSGAYIIGGGKLTTYRHIAQKAVDRILGDLPGHTHRNAGPSRTAKEPLMDNPVFLMQSETLAPDVCDYLTTRYGRGAQEIADLAAADDRLSRRIVPTLPFVFAEIPYGVRREMLQTITDFFRLRTEIFLKAEDNGRCALEESVGILGQALSLGQNEKRKQFQDYLSYVEQNLRCLNRCSS
jgi:glycerol-3-phosphate dehydrogenase